MNAETFVLELAGVTERLNDVLAAENETLRQHQPEKLVSSREEKERLTGLFETQMAAIRSEPEILKSTEPRLRFRLRKAAKRFEVLLADHQRMLNAAKSVTDRMLRTIAENAGRANHQVAGYDRTAAFRPSIVNEKQFAPLALDRRI